MIKILALCLLLAFPTVSMSMGGGVPGGYDMLSGDIIGNPAPEFKLDLLSGGQKSLSDVRGGQKAILMFWATWCPHCHEELGALSAQMKSLEAQGIKLILVDLGETNEQVQRYFSRYGMNFDTFIDGDGATQELYGVIGLPTMYFIDAEGIVRHSAHHVPEDVSSLFK